VSAASNTLRRVGKACGRSGVGWTRFVRSVARQASRFIASGRIQPGLIHWYSQSPDGYPISSIIYRAREVATRAMDKGGWL
jgi:hypothetical protein